MPYKVLRPFQGDRQWTAGEIVSDAQFESWPRGAKLIGRYLSPVTAVETQTLDASVPDSDSTRDDEPREPVRLHLPLK